MKIAISSQGEEKNSLMDLRFGRCRYFFIFNTKDDSFKIIKNKAVEADAGAGIKAANLVLKEDVKVVITGNIGPNAANVLKGSNVKMFTSPLKKNLAIIDDYRQNKLKELDI